MSREMQSRILIIDDDEVVLATTGALLQAAGYEVSTHVGPFGATSAISDSRPDLVLLDVNMPGLSGEALTALVRGNPRFDGIRMYFFAGSQDEEGLRALVEESKADGYILKDDRAELQRRVAAALAAPSQRTSWDRKVARAVRPRVLIIDDDEVVLTTTGALLEAAGYEVSTHLGAFGATSAIAAFLPDLLLVDVNMPGLSGTGFAALVRGMARFDGIRIYFLSSQDEEGLRASVEESGADGYILKGDRAELQRRVAAILAAPSPRRPREGPAARRDD